RALRWARPAWNHRSDAAVPRKAARSRRLKRPSARCGQPLTGGEGKRGRAGSGLVVLAERSDPDVAETHGIAVVLKPDRTGGRHVRRVLGHLAMPGGTEDRLAGLRDHAVQDDRHLGGLDHPAAFDLRSLEDDVVGVPFAGRLRGQREGRPLAIDAADRAIGVGRVLVAVEDLDLVHAMEEDAAVPPSLAVAARRFRRLELEVKLETP